MPRVDTSYTPCGRCPNFNIHPEDKHAARLVSRSGNHPAFLCCLFQRSIACLSVVFPSSRGVYTRAAEKSRVSQHHGWCRVSLPGWMDGRSSPEAGTPSRTSFIGSCQGKPTPLGPPSSARKQHENSSSLHVPCAMPP